MNYADILLSGEPIVLDSGKAGPRAVILCSVHGNEPCGVEALKEILPTLEIKAGVLTCILANPKAYEQKVRFTEANLNRMFRSTNDLSESEAKSYEHIRAKEIMLSLEEADYLLDLHSYSSTSGQPFVICSEKYFDLAKHLGPKIVFSGIDDLHPGSTDGYMNLLNKPGICVECGQHDDPESIPFAQDSIVRFLSLLEIIELTENIPMGDGVALTAARQIYITKIDFKPEKEFKNFEKVFKGQSLGVDGHEEILSPYNGFILFAQKCEKPGQEAFVLGEYLK